MNLHIHCPSSFVGLTRRWRRRVAVASRRWGERGWWARWSGGKLLITRRTTLLLTGRGRRGLVTAMEIEGVKGRQSLRQEERKWGSPLVFIRTTSEGG